jgi:hypothetical protein
MMFKGLAEDAKPVGAAELRYSASLRCALVVHIPKSLRGAEIISLVAISRYDLARQP